MREWIRFHKVSAVSDSLAPLRELDLGIRTGEVLFVVGGRWSGRELLREILGGRAEIMSGKLYLEEERYRKRTLAGLPILCVDRSCHLTQALSLQANLMSLGGATLGERNDLRRNLRDEKGIQKLFQEMELGYAPACPASQVPVREQVLLWFVLAVLRRVPLFCLDCSGYSFSEEDCEVLGRAVEKCRRREIGVVILSERDNALLDRADRVAWMEGGQVRKIFYSAGDYRQMTGSADRKSETAQKPDPVGGAACTARTVRDTDRPDIRERRILGVYDADWPLDCTLPEYLTRQMRAHDLALPDYLSMEKYSGREVVYIPEDSVQSLFPGQSIGRNLILTASRRVGVRAGFVQKDMERFLEQEFCRKFDIELPVEAVEELSEGEKKLLSIYRFVLLHPRVLLVENPFLRSDREERRRMKEYLRELAADGSALVVSAKDPEELEELCDMVWRPRG
ncbi:MAG: hypothetical protein LUE23_01965 [Lachnospiraceae bacterium]|nr:hypothetical protein [Lachnospiraceae bacterium]